MKLVIKILGIVLIALLATSISAHNETDVFEFNMETGIPNDSTPIGPGDIVMCAQTVTNIGNISGQVHIKIIQPFVEAEDTPLYVFDVNTPWALESEIILEGEVVSTYIFLTFAQ